MATEWISSDGPFSDGVLHIVPYVSPVARLLVGGAEAMGVK